MHRPTYLKIDLDQFEKNYEYLKQVSQKKIIPVLKANGYGLGDLELAKTLEETDCEIIALSSYEEAINLRNKGIKLELLVLGYVACKDLEKIIKNNISIVIYSFEIFKEIEKHNIDISGLKVHLKIDSGMHRLGFTSLDECLKCLKLLKKYHCDIQGIMTHFAYSNESSQDYSYQQFSLFKTIVKALNYDFKYIHMNNTDASLKFDDGGFCGYARSGLGLIGFSSFDSQLKSVVALYSCLISIKEIKESSYVGYGLSYQCTKKELIGVLPIGYADGLLRANKNLHLYSNGHYYEIVGNICMDQLMVRIDENCQMLQEFEIFGPHTSIKEILAKSNLTIYELLVLLSDRLLRKYYRHGKVRHNNLIRFNVYETN